MNSPSLDGTIGFRLDGVVAGDGSGRAVSGAGDVDGDGVDDLIIGAYGADPNAVSYAGSSYVLFGRTSGFASVVNLSTLDGTTGFRLDGVATLDFSGRAVSGAGDVNGDGFHDVILGAYPADPNGNQSGSSYVVFGRSGGFASAVELSSLDGATGFRLDGVAASDRSGRSVGGGADVNGDGFDDLLVGAYGADPNGLSSGSTYVVYGRSGGFASTIELSTLDGTTGFRLDGVAASDLSGWSVSGAGDVNGDGVEEVIIGARGADPNGSLSGSSYVLFGSSNGFASAVDLSSLNGTTGFRLDGLASSDFSGDAVSGAGDVNGDGLDDLLVGAFAADPNGNLTSGATYVLFGRTSAFAATIDLSSLNGTTGFQIDGVAAGDQSGQAVNRAGDVNGDGFDDLIVGAPYADPNGSESGTSYVVFGGNFTGGAETQVGGGGSQTLNATLGAGLDVLIGGRGDDTLVSDGGPDVLRGGEGDDVLAIPDGDFSGARRLVGGTGTDTLRLDGAGVTLDLPNIADNRLIDIEQIDIAGSGENRLFVSRGDVLRLSGTSNTLTVRGDVDDRVVVQSTAWAAQGVVNIDGINYNQFTNGAATLNVEADVNTTLAVIELSLLNGMNGVRFEGASSADRSGHSVSGAGDFNADGFDDFLIGAYAADPNGNSSGSAYLVFGRSAGFSAAVDLSTLDGTTGFRMDGVAADDFAGDWVSRGGDVNGDGFGDLIIGAYQTDPNGNDSGSTYVLFGRTGGFSSIISLSSLDGTTGFRLDGVAADDLSGRRLSDAGDVNGDGFDDLVVGAEQSDPNGNDSGTSYVLFGRSTGFAATIQLSALDGTTGFRIEGAAAGDEAGSSVSGAGDVNGDGLDDLIVGARFADPGGNISAGSTYVVFGRSTGFASSINVSALDGTTGFRLDGSVTGDSSGAAVSGLGDVNGDGFDDLVVGAYMADFSANASGSSFVVFGRSAGFASALS